MLLNIYFLMFENAVYNGSGLKFTSLAIIPFNTNI